MKKVKIVAALFGIMIIGIPTVQAQNDEKAKADTQVEKIQNTRGGNFVDADGDGICDNFKEGQGMGLGKGQKNGKGVNFVDEDGDGVCDHYKDGQGKNGKGLKQGKGKGMRNCNGTGRGKGYMRNARQNNNASGK